MLRRKDHRLVIHFVRTRLLSIAELLGTSPRNHGPLLAPQSHFVVALCLPEDLISPSYCSGVCIETFPAPSQGAEKASCES